MLFRQAPFYGLAFASGIHFLKADINICNLYIVYVTKLSFSWWNL